MTDPAIERTISIDSNDTGHGTLSASVKDHPGLMPIKISREGYNLHLRWSEWEEVRDHIEYCSTMMRLEPDAPEYTVCGAMPGLVPYDALPCILEAGHGDLAAVEPDEPIGTAHHFDRLGRSW